MNQANPPSPTAAQLHRRIRASEQDRLKCCELAAADVITALRADHTAAVTKNHADMTAREAVAAALRVFDNPDLLAELVGMPRARLERFVKSVPQPEKKRLLNRYKPASFAHVNGSTKRAKYRIPI